MDTGRLTGKHAIVTGGTLGIGEAIARRFVAEGARVLIVARRPQRGLALVAELGAAARFHELDVTDAAGWRRLAGGLADDPPDVLVNNAGELFYEKPLHEVEPEEWDRELRTNLTSVFLGMRYVLPLMLLRGAGSIINIGSISGLRGQADGPAYQAAKGGMRLLTVNAAYTYAAQGIRVNTVNPGCIDTPKVASEPWERTLPFIQRTPMQRMAAPSEVAAVVSFLASDEASFVTGADYNVDGGYSI